MFLAALVPIGCSSTHSASQSQALARERATLKLMNKHGSGVTQVYAQVRMIDGKRVRNSDRLVYLEPGDHVLTYDVQEVTYIAPKFEFTSHIFGDAGSVVGTREAKTVGVHSLSVSGTFERGKTYELNLKNIHIVTNSDLEPVAIGAAAIAYR
jgi:hypothetical protein